MDAATKTHECCDLMTRAVDRRRYATRSRNLDLLAAGAVLVLILVNAPAMVVYSHVTAFDVRVVRIDATGNRAEIPTPGPLLRRSHLALDDPGHVVAVLERRINAVMRADPAFSSTDATYEWTIRWSRDSARLDQRKVFIRQGGAGGSR